MPLLEAKKALLNSKHGASALSGFLGGAAGGAVMSAISSRKTAKKLLKGGGLVALGGVAYHAFQKYRANTDANAALVDPPGSTRMALADSGDCRGDSSGMGESQLTVVPTSDPLQEERSMPLLRAMVAAAYADGHMTDQEQTRIWHKALQEGLSAAAMAELQETLANPPQMDELVTSVIGIDGRLELYTASYLAIDPGCPAGEAYLAELGERLELPRPLLTAVHQSATS